MVIEEELSIGSDVDGVPHVYDPSVKYHQLPGFEFRPEYNDFGGGGVLM